MQFSIVLIFVLPVIVMQKYIMYVFKDFSTLIIVHIYNTCKFAQVLCFVHFTLLKQ